MRRMDPAVLAIGGIIVLVLIVGLVSVMPRTADDADDVAVLGGGDALTGNVIAEGDAASEFVPSPTNDACTRCSGTVVCAVKDGKAANYESACAAVCSGARVLKDGLCEG